MSKEAHFIRPNGTVPEQDRCTVRVMSHYQEYDSPTTHVNCSYDRSLAADRKPHQQFQRVNFDLVEIDIGRLSWGSVELILVHELAKLSKGADKLGILQAAQKNNKILLFTSDGKQVGRIEPGRCCLMHFDSPIFVKCTEASALLHVTANPA